MFSYFLIFALILAAYILSISFKLDRRAKNLLLFILFLMLLIFTGLRYEVGGDWESYLFWFNRIKNYGIDLGLKEIISSDIGYNLVNLISAKFNLGIYGVNTICAFLFLTGLFAFLNKRIPNPFFGLMIAYPYLIMVVGMGYTRQSVALGFTFIVYNLILENKPYKALFFSILAFTFHKTGTISLILLFLNREIRKKKWLTIMVIALIVFGFSTEVFQMVMSRFYNLYVSYPIKSEGGTLRAITVLIPSLILIIFNRSMRKFSDQRFWFSTSIITAILCFLSLFKLTFADRLLLYFYPVQIVGFDAAKVLEKNMSWRAFVAIGIVIFSLSVMTTWLLFAVHIDAWIPYKNILIEE